MNRRPIYLTRHGVQRALGYDLSSEEVEKMISDGERKVEGKTKAGYALRSKRGVWVAICEECRDQIIVLAIRKGR